MKATNWKERFKNGSRYRYAALVLLFGVLLMFLPKCAETKDTTDEEVTDAPALNTASKTFSIAEEEARLQTALSRIEGIGEVEVLLSL